MDDRLTFFKSFSEKNFKKMSEENEDSDKEKRSEDGVEEEEEEEYSSSSYDTSSSDNYPSPKTPKKKSNYSNEQLYFMIEKMQRKISLIERILEKKLLK